MRWDVLMMSPLKGIMMLPSYPGPLKGVMMLPGYPGS
jgi:hypothetical protein